MAKIEMDVSEYEIMKENKKLLEDALKREKELQASIKQLNDEKIKAYEEASMKVVKYVNTSVSESLILKDKLTITNIIHAIDRYRKYDLTANNYILDVVKMECEIEHNTSSKISKIETVGLDSYLYEIEQSVRKELGDKIIKAEEIITADIKSSSRIELLQRTLEDYSDKLEKRAQSIVKLEKSLEERDAIIDKYAILRMNLAKILNGKIGIFSKGDTLEQLKVIINS